jgi:hypothetical protein
VLVCDFEGRFIVRVEEDEVLAAEPCALIGILDDGWAGLSGAARQRLAAADLVIGAGRTLELVRPHLPVRQRRAGTWTALGQRAGVDRDARRGRQVASPCWPPATPCAMASPRF